MEELKSVRLFSTTIDIKSIKATLFKIDNSNFKVDIVVNGKKYTFNYNNDLYPVEKKNNFNNLVKDTTGLAIGIIQGFNLNNLTPYDYFLNDAIISLSKAILDTRTNIGMQDFFSIVQDPWLEDSTNKRNYGYDPYYLNNSSVVYINWFIGNEKVGGYEWSDNNGNELDFISVTTDKENITKKVFISSPDSKKFTIDLTNKISENITSSKIYPYNAKDEFILDEVIRIWKLVVGNYNLEKCINLPCNSLEYKSPILIDDNLDKPKDSIEKKTIKIENINNNIKVRENLVLKLTLL